MRGRYLDVDGVPIQPITMGPGGRDALRPVMRSVSTLVGITQAVPPADRTKSAFCSFEVTTSRETAMAFSSERRARARGAGGQGEPVSLRVVGRRRNRRRALSVLPHEERPRRYRDAVQQHLVVAPDVL
jgi:hypothetical protein